MKFGARIIKTGIALVLAIYISDFLQFGPLIITAIAATLAIQPSVYRTWQYGIEQFQSNIAGATIAILFSVYLGTSPIIIALAVMLVIGINLQFHFERSIPLSIVTVLSIMEGGTETQHFLLFAVDRFLLILIGILSAIVVNALLFPPKYEQQIIAKLKNINDQMTSILRIILDTDKNERLFRNSLKDLKKELDNLGNLLNFEEEAKSYFRRKLRFTSSRKLVIFKAMMNTAQVGTQIFNIIEKYHHIFNHLPSDFAIKVREELLILANYQDRIYSKFEGKINATNKSNTGNLPLEDSYLNILNDTSAIEDPNIKLELVMIITLIHEYNKQLDHLDKLIASYHSHHKD